MGSDMSEEDELQDWDLKHVRKPKVQGLRIS